MTQEFEGGREHLQKQFVFKGVSNFAEPLTVELSTLASPLDGGNVSKPFRFQMNRGFEGGREHVQKPIGFKRV